MRNNVQQLARALELPTQVLSDDIFQMIDGQLNEMGCEPQNVQVLVQELTAGVQFSLQSSRTG